MAQPFSFIGCGFYKSTTAAQNIALTDKPDFFQVTDTTNWGAANTAVAAMQSSWNNALPQGAFLQTGQISAAATANYMYGAQGTTGGFTFVDQSHPPTYAKVAITAVNDSTWVVSTGTTTGLAVGDWVRLINVVSYQQFSGPNLYQITAISAGVSFTLGYAATAGLTIGASGTTGFYQKVYPGAFYPSKQYVANITQASQAKVYFYRQNDYTPGEMVDFQIPVPYGMTQLSNLTALSRGPARVLTVTNTATESSIVIDVDTTGFTAFTYPTTAAFAGGASPAICVPAGSGIVPLNGSATVPQSPPGTNLVDAFDNRSQYLMNIGTSVVGANSAVMFWEAWKADYSAGITNA